MNKLKKFEITHYVRSDNYIVKVLDPPMYLQYNELTGGVGPVNYSHEATVLNNKKDCKELIEWYLHKTPIEKEELTYVIEKP